MSRTRYKTRQMTELLDFLKSVPGRHVTVNEICLYFHKENISMGTTTVYRNLEKLVTDGLVTKYTVAGIESACFEYIGDGHREKESDCYHCKCEKCGRLIHMHCQEVEILRQHMMEHHSFNLDVSHTVFYGICDQCKSLGSRE